MKIFVTLLPNKETVEHECDPNDTVRDLKCAIVAKHFTLYKAENPDCDENSLLMFFKDGVSFGQLRPDEVIGSCGVVEGDTVVFDFEDSSIELELKQQKDERPPTD
ncbi:uncharacterized protein MONOS_18568 [Monocercomonoides exilis]|uniref:uncharacterized protein n=1 Tax=Monocercomonoides exilis TaxID=2049356 RepID=UPI0035599E69|nr:hypothetical protein MONOS_18568 [Monocercomonoides exilis]